MERELRTKLPITPQAARWAGNVALRFEPYSFAEPEYDIYEAICDRLHLNGHELIVDVGSNDGKFVYSLNNRLRSAPHFRFAFGLGEVIGIEPNAKAVEDLKRKNNRQVRFFKASAEKLPGANKTAHVVTANFMMYFAENPDACFQEFLRVLRNDGKFVLSTSGYFNKPRQRVFEELAARHSGLGSPERMNESFDTDVALETLPKYFTHIYQGSYHGKMVFRNEDEALAYYHSFFSMAEFFDPPLADDEMRNICEEILAPVVQREIEAFGYFEDYIQRDFFICSNDPEGLRIYDPVSHDIRTVIGYEIEQLGADYSTAA